MSRILVGDCRELLATLPERSVQTCVTSPPFFGLRDYGHDDQIGLEPTPDEFVTALVDVFREVRRVLRDDGTVWLNLGDSYSTQPKGNPGALSAGLTNGGRNTATANAHRGGVDTSRLPGVKPKDLIGIPWMVAFALRADGWYLRSDIIWAKPNPMPESVTDRPTKAHEYLFLLSKGPRYFYDADAIREEGKDWSTGGPGVGIANTSERYGAGNGGNGGLSALAQRYKDSRGDDGRELAATGERHTFAHPQGRNKRSVWTVATQPYAGAHFATFPPKLIEPCILAGSSPKACGECGAPWQRVVKRAGGERTTDTVPSRLAIGHDPIPRPRSSHPPGWRKMAPDAEVDLGWLATCDHDDDTGRSVVLDPFAGAGTVGVVCGWHGRDFIGCELNPTYAEMAEARIALEGRPGGRPEGHKETVVSAGQASIFDL